MTDDISAEVLIGVKSGSNYPGFHCDNNVV